MAFQIVEDVFLQGMDSAVLGAEDVDAAVFRKEGIDELECDFSLDFLAAGKAVKGDDRVDDASEHEGKCAVLDICMLGAVLPVTSSGSYHTQVSTEP